MLINPYSYVPAGPTDPSFGNVSLLMHFDGADGSGTITDSSPRPKTITRNGGTPRVLTTTQKKFGTASLSSVTGNGGISASLGGAGDFNFGSGDWTVEGWIAFATTGLSGVILNLGAAANWTPVQVFWIANNYLGCYISSNGTSWDLSNGFGMNLTNADVVANDWYHFAVVRTGNNLRMGSRGTMANTVAFTGSFPNASGEINFTSGTVVGSSTWSGGYLDEIRITKGVARYTGTTYTVPTAPFPNS